MQIEKREGLCIRSRLRSCHSHGHNMPISIQEKPLCSAHALIHWLIKRLFRGCKQKPDLGNKSQAVLSGRTWLLLFLTDVFLILVIESRYRSRQILKFNPKDGRKQSNWDEVLPRLMAEIRGYVVYAHSKRIRWVCSLRACIVCIIGPYTYRSCRRMAQIQKSLLRC